MAVLIAVEGIDGSGKGTQARLLQSRLQESGRRTTLLSFPRYSETHFARMAGQFLDGRLGTLQEASPFLVSLLFAGDRFESRGLLQNALATSDVVLCDRYVTSNMAHQGAKLEGARRQELLEWVAQVEHEVYGLPTPDVVLYLDVPVEQAQELVTQKSPRAYTSKAADLQEADAAYLQQVHSVYRELAQSPNWVRIDCCANGRVRPVAEIAAEVLQAVEPLVAGATRPAPPSLQQLVASRRRWLDEELQPWARTATGADLTAAEREWIDLAGRAPSDLTLWRWAWSRFPDLIHRDLGIEETHEVEVLLKSGDRAAGYPDSRRSGRLELYLSRRGEAGFEALGPFKLDDIASVRRVAPSTDA